MAGLSSFLLSLFLFFFFFCELKLLQNEYEVVEVACVSAAKPIALCMLLAECEKENLTEEVVERLSRIAACHVKG